VHHSKIDRRMAEIGSIFARSTRSRCSRHVRFAPIASELWHRAKLPQRSPPSLLTTAACGGLRSTPDSTSKGPPSSLVQLRTAVWTGGFRRKHTPGNQRNIKRAGGAPQYDALVESSVPQDLEQIVDRREISILRSGRREGFALPRLASDRCSVARAFRAALHKMSMFAANS